MQSHLLKLFILTCLSFAFSGLAGGALGVVWIHVQETFALTVSALGILVSVTTVGRLITSFGSGFLIGRFGIAAVLLVGMTVTMGSLFGFALAPGWGWFLAAGFLGGVGAGLTGTGINSFAATNFSSSRMNWLHAAFGVGATLGPTLIIFLVIDLGWAWRGSYVLFGVLGLMLVALFFITRREWRIQAADDDPGSATSSAPLNATLRLPVVWLLVTIFIVATGTELTTGQLTNSLLVEGRAIDPKIAGSWVSMYWGSLTVSRIVIGFVIDRVDNGMFLRLNMAGTVLGTVLLWSNVSMATSLIGLAIIGFTVAPFAPLMTSDTPRRVGLAHTANTVGFQFTGAGLGMALLPWLAGALAERFGFEVIPPFLFVAALLVFLLHELIVRREKRRLTAAPTLVR